MYITCEIYSRLIPKLLRQVWCVRVWFATVRCGGCHLKSNSWWRYEILVTWLDKQIHCRCSGLEGEISWIHGRALPFPLLVPLLAPSQPCHFPPWEEPRALLLARTHLNLQASFLHPDLFHFRFQRLDFFMFTAADFTFLWWYILVKTANNICCNLMVSCCKRDTEYDVIQ